MTISAGAAAGLLVALMVVSTTDGYGAELVPTAKATNGFVHPGDARGFNPQPDTPRERFGDGSVNPVAGQ